MRYSAKRPGRTRQIRRQRRTLIVGAVLLAAMGCAVYGAFTVHSGLPWSKPPLVRASFTDVDTLSVGADVREHSVRIGKVEHVKLVNGRAEVTMALDDDRPMYRNATASVYDFSPLGEKLIELDPGDPSAGRLTNGVIAHTRTVSSADLYNVLNVFDRPTRGAVKGTLRELGGGVAGQGPNLNSFLGKAPDMLNDMSIVTRALASKDARLPSLLRSIDQLAGRFDGREGQIASLTKQADTTLAALGVDNGAPLNASLDRLPATLTTARESFTALAPPLQETESAMQRITPGAAALAASEPDLRGVLREAPRPLRRVPGVAEEAKPALEHLTKTARAARMIAPDIKKAMQDALTPLRVLAPYAADMRELFIRGDSFVAEKTAPGLHYARINLNPSVATATGAVADTSCLKPRNPYPKPGETFQDEASCPATDPVASLLGGTR